MGSRAEGAKPRGSLPSMTFFSVLLGRDTHTVFMDGWEGIVGYVSVSIINDQSKHVR